MQLAAIVRPDPGGAPIQVDDEINAAIAAAGRGQAAAALVTLARLAPAGVGGGLRRNLVGLLHLQIGRADTALAWFDAAIAADPTFVDAKLNRANALQRLGRFADAAAAFEAAIAAGADDPSTFLNQGLTLRELHRDDAAAAAMREALRRRPAYPAALRALAHLLAARAERQAALDLIEAALQLQPADRDLLIDRGTFLLAAGRAEEAVSAGADALRRHPGDPQLLNNYGVALHQAGRPAAALAVHERAAKGGAPHALFNKGNVLLKMGRPAAALAAFDAVLRHVPDHTEAVCSRAVALKMLGRFEAAAEAFDDALTLDPGSVHARNNRGALRLLRGDFERGWDDYEARWRADAASGGRWQQLLPEWAGENPAGLRLLVLDEQGHGDAIQFARYLPLLKAAGAEVTFLCRRRLHRLFAGLPLPITLVDDVPAKDAFDRQVALSSLPRLFRTRADSIPHADHYLQAEPALAAAWRDRLGPGFSIGLCWQGNQDFRADPSRSLTLDALRPLLELPGVRAVSLQRTETDAAPLPRGLAAYPMPLEDAGDAFVETAAAMAALDAIVTCDTSIAHLAGALGRPCFVLLKAVPDWRWMLDRPDTPWYPSLALVREAPGDDGWAAGVARVAQAVALMRDARPQACS